MIRRLLLLAALSALCACEKHEAAPTCVEPALVATAKPNTYAAEREAARNCVKKAAFALARAGSPAAQVADGAVSQCAAEEAAIGKSGTQIWDYERAQLHEDLVHLARITATQARAMGCGRGPNAGREEI